MSVPIIDLKPVTDPLTGQELWTVPEPTSEGRELATVPKVTATTDGSLSNGITSVAIPRDVFSGQAPVGQQEPDWNRFGQAAESGQKVVLDANGNIRVAESGEPSGAAVSLPRVVFAGDLPEIGTWREQTVPGSAPLPAAPPVVLTPQGVATNGQAGTAGTVALPTDTFAAGLGPSSTSRLAQEKALVSGLKQANVRWIKQLSHTSSVPGMPSGAPTGWLYRPRPNKYGDQLVGVVAYHPLTQLYHCHYWRFEADVDGTGRKSIDLPRYLGRHPDLTHHKAHLYTDSHGGAVLCLSTRVNGGMPSLDAALVQALKWADGTGEVVRGRLFPYN